MRVDRPTIPIVAIADHAVIAVIVAYRVTRSGLRVDAVAIGVVGIADQAVVAIGIAYHVTRSILRLIRSIRWIETPLCTKRRETRHHRDN